MNTNTEMNKNEVIIKNMFASSPISRSQAKIICNNLEKFKEVVIDFSDVPWMGQGFAHQLFVVFAKQHENIKLVPVNMNEDVTKMYNHVIATV